MGDFTKTAIEGGVGIIAINNPPANVLSRPVFQEIDAALGAFLSDASVRGIVLTGEGANFAAGADIREIAQLNDVEGGTKMSLEAQKLCDRIAAAPIPVVAAINGYCFGGGCEIILACPLRVASDKARIRLPEITLGIIPGMGGTQRLPRIVGVTKALEIILTGEPVSAQEAHRIGLVNMVVPEAQLRRQAVGLAARIGKLSKVSVSKALDAVRGGMEMTLEKGLQWEARKFGELCASEDKKIGIAAFLDKNPNPPFVDR